MPYSLAVVIPYYNEVDYLSRTLESCLAQRRLPDQLILVDNGSTDGSEGLCRKVLKKKGSFEVLYLSEENPGRLNAVAKGCQYVTSDLVSFWDADTYYPPHYFELCVKMFHKASRHVVAVMAPGIHISPDSIVSRFTRLKSYIMSKIITKNAFAGSYGQTIRADALNKAGGYSASRWNYVMEDHEFMCRLFKVGRSLYHTNLWCITSDRRKDTCGVHWSLYERMLYHLVPHAWHDWFFYRFLAPRFERRKMQQEKLRERAWLDKAS